MREYYISLFDVGICGKYTNFSRDIRFILVKKTKIWKNTPLHTLRSSFFFVYLRHNNIRNHSLKLKEPYDESILG